MIFDNRQHSLLRINEMQLDYKYQNITCWSAWKIHRLLWLTRKLNYVNVWHWYLLGIINCQNQLKNSSLFRPCYKVAGWFRKTVSRMPNIWLELSQVIQHCLKCKLVLWNMVILSILYHATILSKLKYFKFITRISKSLLLDSFYLL